MQMIKTWKVVVLLVMSWQVMVGYAQDKPLALDTCYALARANYPLIREHALIAQSRDYAVTNISTGHLPQFSLSGKATYQSEVTKIPIHLPGMTAPELSKDQY